MIKFGKLLSEIIGGTHLFFVVATTAFIVKILLLSYLLRQKSHPKMILSRILLGLILVGALGDDTYWLMKLGPSIISFQFNRRLISCFLFANWALFILQYQSLALFVETIVYKKPKIKLHNVICILISTIFAIIFLYYSGYTFCYKPPHKDLVLVTFELSFIYAFSILSGSMYHAFTKIKDINLPRILKKQVTILLKNIVLPYMIVQIAFYIPMFVPHLRSVHNYGTVSLSLTLMTYVLFYCSRKLVGLRFLNFTKHVQTYRTFDLVEDFRDILYRLSHVTTVKELRYVTQSFFRNFLRIPFNKVQLSIEDQNEYNDNDLSGNDIASSIAGYVTDIPITADQLANRRILVYDEIYLEKLVRNSEESCKLLTFMQSMNADIFVPIFYDDEVVANIIVTRDARPAELYSDTEISSIQVFASYLGNFIDMFSGQDLVRSLEKQKAQVNELYKLHREMDLYRETTRNLLKNSGNSNIHIAFYDGNKLQFSGAATKSAFRENQPLEKKYGTELAATSMAKQALKYQTDQTTTIKNASGSPIILNAIPEPSGQSSTVIAYNPPITGTLKRRIELIKDPSKWHYLLFLETTEIGLSIDDYIPSDLGEFINFKTELLSAALGKEPVLLDIPKEDLDHAVEILHRASHRETLHTIKLSKTDTPESPDLLEVFGKLDKIGTLFIQDIHRMRLDVQNQLAEFIRHGMCHYSNVGQDEQKSSIDIRILCSSTRNLHSLASNGLFSLELLKELTKNTISMPSINMLSEKEICQVADDIAIKIGAAVGPEEHVSKHKLNSNSKVKIIHDRPQGFCELKRLVGRLLVEEEKDSHRTPGEKIIPAKIQNLPMEPTILGLGKKALKDRKTMEMLWGKFRNQNKIAELLGVNRSTVHRRCKEYKLR